MRYFFRHLRTRYILVPPGVNPLEYQPNGLTRSRLSAWLVILLIVGVGIISFWIALSIRREASAQAEFTSIVETSIEYPGYPEKATHTPTMTPTSFSSGITSSSENIQLPSATPTTGVKSITVPATVIVRETVIVHETSPAQQVVVTRMVPSNSGGASPQVREVLITQIVIHTPNPGPTNTPWIVTATTGVLSTATIAPTQTPWIITNTPGPTQTPWIRHITNTPGPTQTPWIVTATPTFTSTQTITATLPITDIYTPTPTYTTTITVTEEITN